MNKNVYSYMKELEDRINDNKAANQLIEDRQRQLEEELKHVKDSISKNFSKITQIKEMTVEAELSDILYLLSQELGIASNELNITYSTDFDFHSYDSGSAVEKIEYFNSHKDEKKNPIKLQFDIQEPLSRNSENPQKFRVIAYTKLNTTQKDGLPLSNHLKAIYTEQDNEIRRAHCRIQIDQPLQLILPFKMGDLISRNDETQKITPKDKISDIILNAASLRQYRENREEMHTNN